MIINWLKDRHSDWAWGRIARQRSRCAAGKHRWKNFNDQIRCSGVGCNERWSG